MKNLPKRKLLLRGEPLTAFVAEDLLTRAVYDDETGFWRGEHPYVSAVRGFAPPRQSQDMKLIVMRAHDDGCSLHMGGGRELHQGIDGEQDGMEWNDRPGKNSTLDTLREEKLELYKKIPPLDPRRPRSSNDRWDPVTPCSKIRLRLAAMQKVLDKREEVRKKCFGRKSDPGHDEAMGGVERGIIKLKKLEATNCAPGHPMADK